jgi:hypothetical protein
MVCKSGTNLSSVAVDLYAHCGRSAFYAPVGEGANLQVCSPIALIKQVPVQVRLKAEGGGNLRAGGCQGFRLPKALDYANEFWMVASVSAVKYCGPPNSYARFRRNWLVHALKRVKISVQDLPLLEVDNNCAIFFIQNYIGHHQRENVDCLMGNTSEFLSKVPGTTLPGASCEDAPIFGSTRAVAMPLPVYSKMLGTYGASLVTASMLFSEVLIEIELNPIHHIFEVINTECCDQTPNGANNCGNVGQILQCDGSCPDFLSVGVYAHGAVGTPEEKKALAKRTYSMPIKTFTAGSGSECLDCDTTSITLRLSLATTALHIGVFNTTETHYSDVASTLLGGYGVTPIECATLNYDSAIRVQTDVVLSKMGQIAFSSAPGVSDSYTITIPLSFDMAGSCFTQATEFARIANAFVDIKLTDEARMAQKGYDQFGHPISNTECAGNNTVKGEGVKQKFTVKTCAAVFLPVVYTAGSVSLVV